MKPWIKQMLATAEMAYLCVRNQGAVKILPWPYTYDRGRLITAVSILHVDIIQMIEKYPVHYLLIQQDNREIGLLGRITIDKSDLDNKWRGYNSVDFKMLEDPDKPREFQTPYLLKQVVLTFIPSKLEIHENGSSTSFEMEILS